VNTSKRSPEILFLCVHNAGRSQMAAAFARSIGGGRVVINSAGSDPTSTLNPVVVEAMKEVGLDISDESPKKLTDQMGMDADVIVTMGCGDACPVYLGKRYEDWDLEDPSGKDPDTVRRIRNEIEDRVNALLRELTDSSKYAHDKDRPHDNEA
jgi:arsenate reductase